MDVNLTEEFTNKIEKKILSGEWEPGRRLPPLRELAETMGVSRSVVNAGIARLGKGGYLVVVPRKYIEVADWKKDGTLDALTGLSREGLLKGEALDSVLQARLLVECECVRLACENASAEKLEALRTHIEAEKAAASVGERVKNDIEFHHMISVMSGNIAYPLIIKSFEKIAERLVTLFYERDEVFETVTRFHGEICAYIEKKDAPKAVETMERLLKHGEKEIQNKL